MASSRSDFLKQAAGAAAVVAGAGVGAGALAAPASAALFNPKEYLLLDGVNVGQLVKASGGRQELDVVVADFDADGNPDKLIGGLSHGTEFTFQIGAGMSKAMYDWITDSMSDPTVRKNGSVVAADFDYRELSRRSFTNAQITSVTIPRLVNAAQAIPAITVGIEAESADDETPSSTPVSGAKQKKWLCSNFRFECRGIPANRVASIDSFTWTRTLGAAGASDDTSDLSLTVAPGAWAAWQQWYDNFALGGDTSDERDALLTVWSLTPQVPLFTCSFGGLGIHTLVQESVLTKEKIELYVETMTFQKK
ncbi:MAG: hypothetical protein QOG85_1325 [Gaiellaceae bacterium]|jgi:hypothetical protein|nr:hypothetical protein [Gaiellaceae bacterium]